MVNMIARRNFEAFWARSDRPDRGMIVIIKNREGCLIEKESLASS